MSGPVGFVQSSKVAGVDDLTRPGTWEHLQKLMEPLQFQNPFKPADAVMMELARYAETHEGQQVLAWVHSITAGTPYPQQAFTIEQTALAAAKHQGRVLPGVMIGAAIEQGKQLRENLKG